MSHFYESLHPDDLPPSHQGEPWPEDAPSELSDTAVTTWLGGRQATLAEAEEE